MFRRIKPLMLSVLLLAIVFSLLTFTIAPAASGQLDTTFSGDGRLTTDFLPSSPGRNDIAYAIAIGPNGKIVAAGSSASSGIDFALARYNANGTVDTTFSGDGRILTNFGGEFEEAYDVAVQSDGKIVVVGKTCKNDVCDVALARYTTSGTLDATFSGDGKKVTNYGGPANDNGGNAIAIQLDGKILVAGFSRNATDFDFAIYRYTTSGNLDTTFSGDGVAVGNFGFDRDDYAYDLAIQDNGKIVVLGTTGVFPNKNFAIARLNANGTADPTFSDDSRQITNFSGNDVANAVAIQPNGKIVVAGYTNKNTANLLFFAVARYNANGTLDTTFNTTGKKVFAVNSGIPAWAADVLVQSDGKIVVVGTTVESIDYFALVRLNTNGSLDTTFSGDGKMKVSFSPSSASANAIALQPSDGKYVLGGYAVGSGYNFALARVLP